MSTTSVRLPQPLKAAITELAAEEGQTTHAFIVEALQQRVDELQARRHFVAEAQQRLRAMERNGRAVPWNDARQQLLERAGRAPRGGAVKRAR